MVIGSPVVVLLVKFICVDLVLLSATFHFSVQSPILFTAVCRHVVASASVFAKERIAVSSAKVAIMEFSAVGISEVYNRYQTGPSMLHCGTPALIGFSSENSFSNLIRKYRSDKYDSRMSQ